MPKATEIRSFTEIQDCSRPAADICADAAYLAAMVHFGQPVIPMIILVRHHIVAITAMLKVAQKRREEVPDAVAENLEAMAQVLQDVQTQFKAEFFRKLKARGASTGR